MSLHDNAQSPARRAMQSLRAERGPHRLAHASVRDALPTGVNDIYEIGPRITHIDRAIIRNYFQGRGEGLSERRRYARVPTRPAALSSQVSQHALPVELERKLSPLPDDCERVLVGRDVFLVQSNTGAVMDILHRAGAAAV